MADTLDIATPKVQNKKGYARLKALGKERILALNNQMARGASMIQCARLIQQEWGEFQDVTEKALSMQLLRYKHDHVDTISAADVEFVNKDRVYGKLNVLDEFVWLVESQKTRLAKFMLKEKQAPLPLTGVTKEVELMQSLLKDVQKLQFDLGIDEFKGPVLQGGRMMAQQVTTPDGTVVQTQVMDAVEVAKAIIKRRQEGEALEYTPDE